MTTGRFINFSNAKAQDAFERWNTATPFLQTGQISLGEHEVANQINNTIADNKHIVLVNPTPAKPFSANRLAIKLEKRGIHTEERYLLITGEEEKTVHANDGESYVGRVVVVHYTVCDESNAQERAAVAEFFKQAGAKEVYFSALLAKQGFEPNFFSYSFEGETNDLHGHGIGRNGYLTHLSEIRLVQNGNCTVSDLNITANKKPVVAQNSMMPAEVLAILDQANKDLLKAKLYIDSKAVKRALQEKTNDELVPLFNALAADRDLVVVIVENGGSQAATDILVELGNHHPEVGAFIVDYVRCDSYGHNQTPGELKLLRDLSVDVAGKNVFIIDDVADSGQTLAKLTALFVSRGANLVQSAVKADKPLCRKVPFEAGVSIIDGQKFFLIGSGCDQHHKGRAQRHYSAAPGGEQPTAPATFGRKG